MTSALPMSHETLFGGEYEMIKYALQQQEDPYEYIVNLKGVCDITTHINLFMLK